MGLVTKVWFREVTEAIGVLEVLSEAAFSTYSVPIRLNTYRCQKTNSKMV